MRYSTTADRTGEIVRRRPEPETRASTNLRQVIGGIVRFRGGRFWAPALALLPDGASVYVLPDGVHAVHVYLPGTRKSGVALCRATWAAWTPKVDPAQLALAEVAQ